MFNGLINFARLLLYATAITPLIIASDYYFPYIVPKAVFFRIVVELALAIWFYLWWRGRSQPELKRRVRQSYFVLMLATMLAIDFLASIFGYSFTNSFFSDIERSWGIYTLLHLYLFYFLARSFFGNREWTIYLHCLFGSTLAVAIYGIVQYYPAVFGINLFGSGPGRIMSTLGNPAYAAMILIFGMAIGLYLFLNAAKREARYFYLAAVALEFFAFTRTGIRSAYLGFLGGLFIGAVLFLLLSKARAARLSAGAMIIILLSAAGSVVAFRQNKTMRSLPIVNRLVSINLRDSTVITRLVGWRAALSGFKENPVLGVGLENFNVVFNKYFDPIYYTYAPTEPYFDRAHNSYLDRLSMTGLSGLLAFFGLIIVLVVYLYQGYKRNYLTRGEIVIFAGLTAAYLIHIIFVFDDLSALLFLLSFLALLEFRRLREPIYNCSGRVLSAPSWSSRAVIALSAFFLIFWFGLKLNWQISSASKNEIRAIVAENRDRSAAGNLFQQALSVPYIPRNVLVTPYVDFLVKQANEYQKIRSAESKNSFDANYSQLARALTEEHKKNKLNPLFLIKLSTIHSARWLMYRDAADANQAIVYIREAIELSPNRPQYYNLLAESYAIFGDAERAIAAAEKSYGMNRDYRETYLYLVRSYAVAGQFDKAIAYWKEMLARGEPAAGDEISADLVSRLTKANELAKAKEIGEQWLTLKPDNTRALIGLTVVALKQGRQEEAIKLAQKVAEADGNFRSDVDYIVREIKKGNAEALLKQLGQ